MKWIIIGLIGLACPIWKDPGWEGGVSAYEAIFNLATKSQKEHISTEEALYLCRQAFEQSQ